MAALDAPRRALPPTLLARMSDATLAGLIAAGSDDAVAALDARYRRRLMRFARGFVPGGIADAEDAVQEAMVRAVRALRGGSRPEAIGPWLHRIARNCALDLGAARRRQPVVELTDRAHPVAEDADATLQRRLGVRGLVADVGTLPATQRSALVLRELEGRSYAAIADELDVTVPAVKSLLVRARQGLRRAQDERPVAAFAPIGLFSRLGERAAGLLAPLATGTAPKVACVAVVAAGALPAGAPPAHHARQPAGQAAAPAAHHAAGPPHGLAAVRAVHADRLGRPRCPADAVAAEYGNCAAD